MDNDLRFDGVTYEKEHDQERLTNQLERVKNLMADGRWRTLDEIAFYTKSPVPSISTRLRDLRKERFGSHTVERRARGERSSGLFEYRVVPK